MRPIHLLPPHRPSCFPLLRYIVTAPSRWICTTCPSFKRSNMRYTFQFSCHWIFANSGATHLCSVFPHRPLAPPFPHLLPFVSDPARYVLSTTFLSLLSPVLILLTQCNPGQVDESNKVCRFHYGRWLVYYSLRVFSSPLVLACALWLTAYQAFKVHLSICLLGLALDGEIALESIGNRLVLSCHEYKSSDVSVYFIVMNITLELISS